MAEQQLEEVIKNATELFKKTFKCDPLVAGCAPGRVNLIGEHTDYNDGYVLPMALPFVTVVVGKRNNSRTCHVVTTNPDIIEPEVKFELPNEKDRNDLFPGKPDWANYIKGVVFYYKGKVHGFDAAVATSVPIGGGLSSSAALEVATYMFLEALDDEKPESSLQEKAKACQRAENEFSGVPCGIMDQIVSFMGKKDHALLLDCRTLDVALVPLKNPEITVLITNTNVHHKLAESQYSIRTKQCKTATKMIGESSLRDVSVTELAEHKRNLDELIYRRALHVVSEIERTFEAAKALRGENYEEFGKLMQDSHKSLRELYEVSCPELDTVVEAALEVDGVYGARMTGGGFGGCTVTLLKTSAVEETKKKIQEKYEGKPSFYICQPGDGAKIVQLK